MSALDDARKPRKIQAAQRPKLPIFRLSDALNAELSPRDYVLPSLPVGKVGLLAAAGGTGKSFWTLQACFQIAASGCCNFDLSGAEMDGGPEKIGSTLLVSLEDEAEDLTRRLQSIRGHWFGHDDQYAWIDGIAENELFQMMPLSGLGLSLFDQECEPLPYIAEIREHAQTMTRLRLIVVDTLRRSHDGDENNNGQMSKVLRTFEKLARDLNCAILLVHHENKAAMGNGEAGAGALRGASAIVDNARWVMRMQTMTKADGEARGLDDDERRFWIKVTNEKTNYGPLQPAKWLQRVDGGVLVKDEPPASQGMPKTEGRI